MRILVLDSSRVLHHLVDRLAPDGVEAEEARSFPEALHLLQVDPPDALIVNLTLSALPWSELYHLCHQQSPPIPILFESCVFRDPAEAGLQDTDASTAFLAKPYSLSKLRSQIDRLVASPLTTPPFSKTL